MTIVINETGLARFLDICMTNSLKCRTFFYAQHFNEFNDIEQLCHKPDGFLVKAAKAQHFTVETSL